MTKKANPLNKFAPHGLPAKVITFFMANPDETLTRMDVAEKFSATASSVHTQLKPAVDSGALLRLPDEDGQFIYSPGPAMAAARMARNPPKRGTRASLYISQADIDKIQPERGVPITSSRLEGTGKWDALLAKLTEPDMSVAIPIEWHKPLLGQAAKHNRKGNGHPQYLVRKTSDTTARLWRTK